MGVVYAVLCISAALALGCGPQVSPPDLVGVWRTAAPAYEDRVLELQPGWVVFGTGGHASLSYPRDGESFEPNPEGGTLCTFYYRLPDGTRTELRLVFLPGVPDELRFENRTEVWLRERDARGSERG